MNILILTGHPAQVHNFRLLRTELISNGHRVFWLATEKDISKYLLNFFNIEYFVLRKPGNSFFSKLHTLILNTNKCFHFIRKNKIDFIVSRVSPYAAVAGFLLRKTHLGLADTESSGIYDTIFTKLLSVFITAKSFRRTLRDDQIRFDGNIELFYLHPNRFHPIGDVSSLLGTIKDEPFIIMRFVSWDAYHDKGLTGFTDENKIKAVKEFSKFAKVFITSEKELPKLLEPYRIKIPPEKMHDVLAHAILFFGESATMASESAVLGTPAIFLNENWFGSTDEEKEYGLLFSYRENHDKQLNAIQKGVELLKNPNLNISMQQNRREFLINKIDSTAFMVWFIENYPKSFQIMKDDPDYQYNFK